MAGMQLPGTLCIRADAHAKIGIGHVMRCLALAQAWQESGGKVAFLCRPLAPSLSQRLLDEGFALEPIQGEAAAPADVDEAIAACRRHQARWLCIDGYQFTAHYRSQIAVAGIKLLVIDDLADSDLSQANAILNQNAYATAEMYAVKAPGTKLLMGARYVLLRREFLKWRDAARPIPPHAKSVLLTMGGSDPGNATHTVMTLLRQMGGSRLKVTILIGSANPHVESLQALLPALQASHEVELLVNPPNVPELVSRADIAITAAGSSAWELACLGVPMMVLETASNQRLVAGWLKEKGVARVFGPLTLDDGSRFMQEFRELVKDAALRQHLSERGKALIDGQGAHRVVAALQSLSPES